MEKNEMLKKIQEDPDFVFSPKHGNSLKKLINKIDRPMSNKAIGRVLLLSSEEIEQLYQESIIELRKEMVDKT